MRRHDYELAVIEAASKLVTYWNNGDYIDEGMEALASALVALDEVKDLVPPLASKTAPPTSHQAAAWVAHSSQRSMAGMIFYRIFWSGHTRGDQAGFTADELIVALGRPHQTVTPRVTELADAGWIVDSGERRPTRTGRQAVVWVPSVAAARAVEEGRRL